ncbi:MAG: hypothetical protein K0S65_243 [Labilithrix sp.]|nr:hypothetical protein [Labilithrix sp.]
MRRVLLPTGVALLVFAAAWSCAFPEVTFGPAEDGAVDGAVDATNDAALEDPEPGPILIDGSSLDALVVADAGGKVDASECTSCDCDSDNYNDPDRDGCAPSGGQFDCDDIDSRTRPLQGFLFDKAEAPRNGDWDCNGKVEKLWNESTTCAGLTLGLGCPNIFGFTEPVACGEKGNWIRCKRRSGLLALDCEVDEQKLEVQLCK